MPGAPVGAVAPPLSKGQLKKKKEAEKREREREQAVAAAALAAAATSAAAEAAASATAVAAAAAAAAAAEPEEIETDPIKAKRKIEKKLRQIDALIERRLAGDVLDKEQLAKVAMMDDLVRQLSALQG